MESYIVLFTYDSNYDSVTYTLLFYQMSFNLD